MESINLSSDTKKEDLWVGKITLINRNGVRFGCFVMNPHPMKQIIDSGLSDYFYMLARLRELYAIDEDYGQAYADEISRIFVMWVKEPVPVEFGPDDFIPPPKAA